MGEKPDSSLGLFTKLGKGDQGDFVKRSRGSLGLLRLIFMNRRLRMNCINEILVQKAFMCYSALKLQLYS